MEVACADHIRYLGFLLDRLRHQSYQQVRQFAWPAHLPGLKMLT